MIRNWTGRIVYLKTMKSGILMLPVGDVATVEIEHKHEGYIGHGDALVPVYGRTLGAVTHLPDPETNVFWLVTREVAESYPDRGDLLVPSDTVRDEEENVMGYMGVEFPQVDI